MNPLVWGAFMDGALIALAVVNAFWELFKWYRCYFNLLRTPEQVSPSRHVFYQESRFTGLRHPSRARHFDESATFCGMSIY